MANLYNESGLLCPMCSSSDWEASTDSVLCLHCRTSYAIEDGVVQMNKTSDEDETARFYAATNGIAFVDTTFAANPLIYITTRAYRQFLDKVFTEAKGRLMDFGSGDGRFSLWAADRGFSLVVAVDSNLPSLKRLAREATKRGLNQVLAVCADLRTPPFRADFFDAVLCIEVLYYLAGALGRVVAIQTAKKLLNQHGRIVIGEFSRMGRAIIDLDAMNLTNVRSLLGSSVRMEKTANTQAEVFQWSLSELRSDLNVADLNIIDQAGISMAAALFMHAWNFTSYPLRPALDLNLQAILESMSDQTTDVADSARNIILAAERRKK